MRIKRMACARKIKKKAYEKITDPKYVQKELIHHGTTTIRCLRRSIVSTKLALDDSKDKFKFLLDTKEFKFSVDEFRRVFQLPQATDNNNVVFVDAPTLSDMLPFFRDELGFSLPMRLPTHFMTKGLPQPVDVPMTKLQPIESTQGTHRTLSASRTPNPATNQVESSAPRKPAIIRIRIPRQPDPETPIPTVTEIDIDSLDEATRLSIAIQRKDLVEGGNNVDADEFVDEILNVQEDLDTRLELGSHKESLEVMKSVNVLIIHDDDEEEESTGDALIRRKGMGIEEIRDTPPPTPIRSPRTYIAPLSLDKETLLELTASDPTPSLSTPTTSIPKPKQDRFKHYKSVFHKMSRQYGYIFKHLKKSFMQRKDFQELLDALKLTLKKTVPLMDDKRVNEIAKKTVPLYVAEGLLLDMKKTQTDLATMIVEAV
ncbi:hypothetical protein Tco_0928867 [Tanacetum coccineum]